MTNVINTGLSDHTAQCLYLECDTVKPDKVNDNNNLQCPLHTLSLANLLSLSNALKEESFANIYNEQNPERKLNNLINCIKRYMGIHSPKRVKINKSKSNILVDWVTDDIMKTRALLVLAAGKARESDWHSDIYKRIKKNMII